MPVHMFDHENGVYYEHHSPKQENGVTFVFVNALTGSTQAWEAEVSPKLRDSGYGTLSYNFRGQDQSPFLPDISLTPSLIVDDLCALMKDQKPKNAVLVGLSIGGLFAAQAWLKGAEARGLVLLNTLRKIGPRIAWINEAMPQIVAAGGVSLFLDVVFPLLVHQEFAEKSRGNFLQGNYQPLPAEHGHANLMKHSVDADWDLAYEKLDLPTLVITGLQDRVFLDIDVVERLYGRLPDARSEVWEDAGHLLPLERPEKLVASLDRFGQELEQRAAA